jgi:hypothetical protein
VSEGLRVLNMPVCFRNGPLLESCKPCQGLSPVWAHGLLEARGEF